MVSIIGIEPCAGIAEVLGEEIWTSEAAGAAQRGGIYAQSDALLDDRVLRLVSNNYVLSVEG